MIQRLKWEEEKSSIDKVKKIKEEIDDVKNKIEEASRAYDFEKLSELKYGKLASLEKELEDLSKVKQVKKTIKEEVTEEEIKEVISKWTGIPVSKLDESERDKVLNLKTHLEKRVIGQDDALEAVTEAIIRARSGLKDPNRPIGSFIFLGPTGVGKTELAKTLTESLFDSEKNMIRLDMSEYMEKFSVSRLVGSPPGYVGYEEGGQLTEAVRRAPYSVILFDEIEKAHPDVFNILLQVLDDGRLTDNQGRTVDFKNTVIIMTSNVGSKLIKETIEDGKDLESAKEAVREEMGRLFRPEFLNRVDDIIMFKPLSRDDVKRIIDIEVGKLSEKLEARKIKIELTDAAKDLILERSYSREFGARPVKRYLQKNIETELGYKILKGEVESREVVSIDSDGEKFIFRSK